MIEAARAVLFGIETVRDRTEELRRSDCIKCVDSGEIGQISKTDSVRKDRGDDKSLPKSVVIGSFGMAMSFS